MLEYRNHILMSCCIPLVLLAGCDIKPSVSPCGQISSVEFLDGEWFDEEAAMQDPRFPELATGGEMLGFANEFGNERCSFFLFSYGGPESKGTFYVAEDKILIFPLPPKRSQHVDMAEKQPSFVLRFERIEENKMRVAREEGTTKVQQGKVFTKIDFAEELRPPE